MSPAANSDGVVRAHLAGLVAAIAPHDQREADDQAVVLDWIRSGAGLYRLAKPDIPPMHLVAYIVASDPHTGRLLLVDHRKAQLRLPAGGHCEPGELPWHTVCREGREELGTEPAVNAPFGTRPAFITVTETCDPHGLGTRHTDVSLWHVVEADPADITQPDTEEFAAVHWLTPVEILATALSALDPEMHRFTDKYLATLAATT